MCCGVQIGLDLLQNLQIHPATIIGQRVKPVQSWLWPKIWQDHSAFRRWVGVTLSYYHTVSICKYEWFGAIFVLTYPFAVDFGSEKLQPVGLDSLYTSPRVCLVFLSLLRDAQRLIFSHCRFAFLLHTDVNDDEGHKLSLWFDPSDDSAMSRKIKI